MMCQEKSISWHIIFYVKPYEEIVPLPDRRSGLGSLLCR